MNQLIGLVLRSVREGSIQLWRNKFLSSTTILLGALILFLLNFVIATEHFIDQSLKNLEARADFSIPLDSSAESFAITSLQNALKNDFTVQTQVLPAENYADFSVPARFHIKFGNLTEIKDILDTLKKDRYQELFGEWDGVGERDFVTLVSKLLRVRQTVDQAGWWLIGIFAIGGTLLAINTFRMVLWTRREEIFIARLVGATQSFIAGPFLFEGFLLGMSAAVLSQILFVIVLREISFFPGGDIFIHLWNNLFFQQILAAGFIGTLGAWLAVRNYFYSQLER